MPSSVLQKLNLLSLPSDIIEAIGDELEVSAVKQLRLTCKDLASHFGSRVFRALTLEVTRDKIEKDLFKLEELSTGKHTACYAARDLYIGYLCPANDLYLQDGQMVGASAEELLSMPMVEERIDACLFDAIVSLKGVQAVIIPYGQCKDHVYQNVMNALRALPNLRRFNANLMGYKVSPELSSLTGLQEISLSGILESCGEDILESLAKAVGQSPALSSITIFLNEWSCHFPRDKFRSLHQLFKYYPTAAAPLRLRHLGMNGCLVRLDKSIMRHISHLTSLSLTHVVDPLKPRTRCLYFGHQDDLAGPLDRTRYGSSLDAIWKTLSTARVCLESITIDSVPESFLDYLSSYSGVKILKLTTNDYRDRTSSDALATRFFGEILPRHAHSLEHLHVVAETQGLWCFGTHNLDAISICVCLKTIQMSIIPSQLAWKAQGRYRTTFARKSEVIRLMEIIKGSWRRSSISFGESNIIKLLLDTVVQCMPEIEAVQIDSATHDGSPPHNPLDFMMHAADQGWFVENVLEQMKRNIDDYTAPPSFQRLPSLTLSCHDSQRPWSKLSYVGEHRTSAIGMTGGSNGDFRELLRYVRKNMESKKA